MSLTSAEDLRRMEEVAAAGYELPASPDEPVEALEAEVTDTHVGWRIASTALQAAALAGLLITCGVVYMRGAGSTEAQATTDATLKAIQSHSNGALLQQLTEDFRAEN